MTLALKDETPEENARRISKEYEEYAYIVSHDLNAPLRHVKEFTRLLIGKHKNAPSNDEQQYIDFLEKSLEKLNDMQDALLVFSRIHTQAGEMREIDCNHTVDLIVKNFQEQDNTKKLTINVLPLPTIVAEPRQIEMLFFNLIDNAVKFHDDTQEKKEISISARENEQEWMFEVRDNGIGIAPQYHEDVFGLFRRLEPNKYPGTGAGLTIARKIARRHGGNMEIDPTPGNGACVIFSIEKR